VRPPILTRAVTAVVIATALGGCGLTDPYQSSTARSTTTATAPSASASADRRDPSPERGGTIPTQAQAALHRLATGAGRPTPQAALERYAAMYLNWDADHVIQLQRQLASISLGQARAQALQAVASASRDPQLTASQITNRGEVVAISPGQRDAAGEWVIVTSEQTSGQGDYHGLPPTLHIIYAQLTSTGRGWVVSEWAPQN
jgi:hypothetical protein